MSSIEDSTDLNQRWKFSQCFGDKGEIENITEADIISTVEFDQTGDYLATGDRGGRVVLFERNKLKKNCEYRFHTEFQSHDAEFDYLKSLEIEEKINKIKWCKRSNRAHFLLSTNDKTIKLWKVYEKSIKIVSESNLRDNFLNGYANNHNSLNSYNMSVLNNNLLSGLSNASLSTSGGGNLLLSLGSLRLPTMELHDTIIAAKPRRIFSNAHTYHINSISINSDGETFISADDLRINLWNMGIADQCFNIVDIKPANMEELTQVITSAAFHPNSCNLFAYSSSKGEIKLADMRENALCDSHAKVFEEYMDTSAHNFFTEITASISDVKFNNDGRYIISRDYMTVKIWDIKMENKPIKTINVHEQLRDRLCDAYENDAIFDKFEVVFSGDGKSMMSGSYNNNFMIYPDAVNSNESNESEIVLQADKSAFKAKKVGVPTLRKNNANGMRRDLDFESVDFKKSILHLSWHPKENSVAIAATNNLYIFSTR